MRKIAYRLGDATTFVALILSAAAMGNIIGKHLTHWIMGG